MDCMRSWGRLQQKDSATCKAKKFVEVEKDERWNQEHEKQKVGRQQLEYGGSHHESCLAHHAGTVDADGSAVY